MFKKYLVIILILLLLLPHSSLYKNIKTSLEYYHIQKVSDLLTFQNIDNVIYSNRLSFVYNLHKNYQKEDISGKIFGMGRQKIMTMKDAEIDIFDIFFSIGIIGILTILSDVLRVISVAAVGYGAGYKQTNTILYYADMVFTICLFLLISTYKNNKKVII